MEYAEKNALLLLLESEQWDSILGLLESFTVDFKAEPYPLQYDRQKFELAKDLSALANARGGLILLGIKTQKNALYASDQAAELRRFDSSLVNSEQYGKVIADKMVA